VEKQNFVKSLWARHGRTFAGVAFCVAALLIAALTGGFDRRVKSTDLLAGKWSGDIAWSSASGRDYNRTMHTALFFLPAGVAGTVMTFPTGAIGGAGTYTFKNGRLTIHCTSLNLDGHSVPMTPYAQKSWFHDTATYTVASDGTNLTLTPVAAGPTSAPCYPLLTSSKPLVLSRVEKPAETEAAPAPKE
jgi:hypothetical protein